MDSKTSSATDLAYLGIQTAGRMLGEREISSVELTRAHLERISALNETLGAFLTTTADLAMLQAAEADVRIREGSATAITGIPMALKDILSTKGVTTTCGSRILEDYVPQYDATVVTRLRQAGAVLLGKTNMDEFAMGSSNENSAFRTVRNPWDLDRVPGGSSGGSAAAVAAGMATFSLGTDTGGSIRQPASLTGVVGLKPTYGRVSRFGVVAFASSLDQVGPITRSVADAATVLSFLAGKDQRDSTTIDAPVPSYADHLDGNVKGLRLGVPQEFFGEGMDPAVESSIRAAIELFRDLGAEIIDVSLPHTEYALSAYYIISPAEAMANLSRFDGVRYGLSLPGEDLWDMFSRTRNAGFGSEVKRRILLGAYVLSAGYYDAYYIKAQQVRTLVRRDYDRAFESVDALVGPTTPTAAFAIGEKFSDPLQMYLSDIFTVPANIAGICAISIPAGMSSGLPIGLQIIGKTLGEQTILRIAEAFERNSAHQYSRPSIEPRAA